MKTLAFSGLFAVISGLILVGLLGFTKAPGEKCIGVFYDNKKVLRNMGLALESFPNFEKKFHAIQNYQSGMLERCQASFVINTEYENKIPRELLEDFISSDRNVTWMGYNVWQLGDHLEKKLGLRYIGSMAKPKGLCTLLYRSRVSNCSERGLALLPELLPTNLLRVEILAESRLDGGRELNPYLVRTKNLYYMADVNFGAVFYDFLSELVGSPAKLVSISLQSSNNDQAHYK